MSQQAQKFFVIWHGVQSVPLSVEQVLEKIAKKELTVFHRISDGVNSFTLAQFTEHFNATRPSPSPFPAQQPPQNFDLPPTTPVSPEPVSPKSKGKPWALIVVLFLLVAAGATAFLVFKPKGETPSKTETAASVASVNASNSTTPKEPEQPKPRRSMASPSLSSTTPKEPEQPKPEAPPVAPLKIVPQPSERIVLKTDDTATLIVLATGGKRPYSYKWFHEGKVVESTDKNVFVMRNLKPEDSGLYHVVVSDAAGNTVQSTNSFLRVDPTARTKPKNPRAGNTTSQTQTSSPSQDTPPSNTGATQKPRLLIAPTPSDKFFPNIAGRRNFRLNFVGTRYADAWETPARRHILLNEVAAQYTLRNGRPALKQGLPKEFKNVTTYEEKEETTWYKFGRQVEFESLGFTRFFYRGASDKLKILQVLARNRFLCICDGDPIHITTIGYYDAADDEVLNLKTGAFMRDGTYSYTDRAGVYRTVRKYIEVDGTMLHRKGITSKTQKIQVPHTKRVEVDQYPALTREEVEDFLSQGQIFKISFTEKFEEIVKDSENQTYPCERCEGRGFFYPIRGRMGSGGRCTNCRGTGKIISKEKATKKLEKVFLYSVRGPLKSDANTLWAEVVAIRNRGAFIHRCNMANIQHLVFRDTPIADVFSAIQLEGRRVLQHGEKFTIIFDKSVPESRKREMANFTFSNISLSALLEGIQKQHNFRYEVTENRIVVFDALFD
ncbi:MAG: hypothetical protein LBR07_08580 [Puniceicoccales bacterium]|jgi:hypothetical protein|nr:hypothetical protein [Puniceicoccales bacterium]